MSIARAFNAAIAIIEGRPKDAREMLREEPVAEGIGTLHSRFMDSVNYSNARAVSDVLHNILTSALRIEPDKDINDRESFYKGVIAVEAILEEYNQIFEVKPR